jgi:hypothetical protein
VGVEGDLDVAAHRVAPFVAGFVYDPTGTLPMTWMSSASQQPINAGDGKIPLYPLGAGLHY